MHKLDRLAGPQYKPSRRDVQPSDRRTPIRLGRGSDALMAFLAVGSTLGVLAFDYFIASGTPIPIMNEIISISSTGDRMLMGLMHVIAGGLDLSTFITVRGNMRKRKPYGWELDELREEDEEHDFPWN